MSILVKWRGLACLGLLSFVGMLGALGCGRAEIAEDCVTSSSTDECVEGAVCTNEENGNNRCRKSCVKQADCPEGTSCNGISGSSNKSCQPSSL